MCSGQATSAGKQKEQGKKKKSIVKFFREL